MAMHSGVFLEYVEKQEKFPEKQIHEIYESSRIFEEPVKRQEDG
jgi:hypothetical protein